MSLLKDSSIVTFLLILSYCSQFCVGKKFISFEFRQFHYLAFYWLHNIFLKSTNINNNLIYKF